ncbi:MAG: hypothetical protein LH481_10555 [Burkholderiales bacterium]|nr:hypothetical protein [Burkholderiales bacterium]
MNSFSYRKATLLALVCATIGVLLWIWLSRESAQQSALRVTTSASERAAASDKSFDKSGPLVSALPDLSPGSSQSRTGIWQSRLGDNTMGLFNENARSMIHSGKLAKIDYGLLMLRNSCMSLYMYGGDGTKAVMERAVMASLPKLGAGLDVGSATEEMRFAGFQRSLERCTKITGAPFTAQERESDRALLSVVRYQGLLMTLHDAKDFTNPEAKAALSQAVSEPMFGALASVLLNKVDYSELANGYGKEQVIPLWQLVNPLVLCRMGDDCGPGGIVTEQLCWLHGICGDNVEEAIWATLRGNGLNTRVMEQFVSRVHQGLVNRDPSIFKKSK